MQNGTNTSAISTILTAGVALAAQSGGRRTVLEELEMQINAAVYPPGTSIEQLKDLLIWAEEEGMTAKILIYGGLFKFAVRAGPSRSAGVVTGRQSGHESHGRPRIAIFLNAPLVIICEFVISCRSFTSCLRIKSISRCDMYTIAFAFHFVATLPCHMKVRRKPIQWVAGQSLRSSDERALPRR